MKVGLFENGEPDGYTAAAAATAATTATEQAQGACTCRGSLSTVLWQWHANLATCKGL